MVKVDFVRDVDHGNSSHRSIQKQFWRVGRDLTHIIGRDDYEA